MISFKKFSKNLFMLVLFLSGSTLSSVTIAKINKNMVFEYATKNGETTGQTASFVEYFGKELQLIYGSGPTEKVTFEKEMAIAVILLNLMTNDDNNYALGNFCKKVNDAWGEATENVEQINPETEVKIWTKLPPGWNPLSISWKTSKITLETFFNDILQLEWRDIYMKSFEENILSDEKFIQEIKTHYLPIVKVLNQGGKLESISIFESLALWIPEKNEKKNSNEVKKFLSKIIEIDLNYELNSFLVGFKEFKKKIKDTNAIKIQSKMKAILSAKLAEKKKAARLLLEAGDQLDLEEAAGVQQKKREDAAWKKHQENNAATKIQSLARGKSARRLVEKKRFKNEIEDGVENITHELSLINLENEKKLFNPSVWSDIETTKFLLGAE